MAGEALRAYPKSRFQTRAGAWTLVENAHGDCAWRLEGSGDELADGVDLPGGGQAFPATFANLLRLKNLVQEQDPASTIFPGAAGRLGESTLGVGARFTTLHWPAVDWAMSALGIGVTANQNSIPRELVYNKRIALTASGSGNIIEDPNLFYAVAILQPGQTPEAAEKALIEEFEKLKAELVSPRELERAKNQFARDYILGRESNEGKATHLAHAAVIHNDITTADGEFDIFMNTTREDLQRVARTYFNETNRLVLYVMPRPTGGRR